MQEELRRALRAPQAWAAMIVCLITLLGYSAFCWIGYILIGEWMEYRESALHMALGGIFFGGFMLLLPFCAALAHSTSVVDDVRTGMMRWQALRSSVGRYARRKAGVCMLVAAMMTAGAFVFHAIIWYMIAIPVDPTRYPNHVIYFSETCFFHDWYTVCHGLPVYAEVTAGIAFTASVWALVALAIAVWVPDKLLTLVIPSFLYYLWNADVTYWLFGVRSVHPAALFNDGLDAQRMAVSLLSYLTVGIVSWLIFHAGCQRRCRYA